jgi:DNA-binding transcriptional MocR family regulator
MPDRRAKEPSEVRLTARQREWLGHLRAAERSGETIQAYAAAHGLSVQSLYQAGKRLRRRGVLEPRIQRRGTPAARAFVKVERPAAPSGAGMAWRIRLPSGVLFECNVPLAHEELVSLLQTLAGAR